VLYNNAGVMLERDDGPRHHQPLETYQRTMDINVMGVLLGCSATAIPALCWPAAGVDRERRLVRRAHGRGHAADRLHRVEGRRLAMTREIAVIYARQGIRANALCPAGHDAAAGQVPLRRRRGNAAWSTSRWARFGEPVEIANGALFLASDESSWMTGQSLIIDGGITAAYVHTE
jgi:NAD(P)-dependent dehydrogenase (short-subunit alcohol dehydrogenase family)